MNAFTEPRSAIPESGYNERRRRTQVPAHVISRPGSPVAWDFGDKATGVLKEDPPRPGSATLLSPPLQRKVPVSVDSHLRKMSARQTSQV